MSDLKERLREWSRFGYGHQASLDMAAAADRIEKLEAALLDAAPFTKEEIRTLCAEYDRVVAEQTDRIAQLEAALRDDPTPEQIYNACMSYRHDFGLLSVEDRRAVVFDATEWLRAWQKALQCAALGEERT